jgi:hypothetical protein
MMSGADDLRGGAVAEVLDMIPPIRAKKGRASARDVTRS